MVSVTLAMAGPRTSVTHYWFRRRWPSGSTDAVIFFVSRNDCPRFRSGTIGLSPPRWRSELLRTVKPDGLIGAATFPALVDKAVGNRIGSVATLRAV